VRPVSSIPVSSDGTLAHFGRTSRYHWYNSIVKGEGPMPAVFRPRRSLLYMPGSNPRALEKARSLPADGLIIDLEDAVAAEAKGDARSIAAPALAGRACGRREIAL